MLHWSHTVSEKTCISVSDSSVFAQPQLNCLFKAFIPLTGKEIWVGLPNTFLEITLNAHTHTISFYALKLGAKIIQLIRLLEGAPERSVSLPVSCQPLMEMSLFPATVGGVNYLYKVCHLSFSTNSATRHLALYSLSSSVKLKELETLLSLVLHLKSTGLHLLSCHQEAGHRSDSISLLCLLQIYWVRESPCCESFTIYVEELHKPNQRNQG